MITFGSAGLALGWLVAFVNEPGSPAEWIPPNVGRFFDELAHWLAYNSPIAALGVVLVIVAVMWLLEERKPRDR